MTPRRILPPPGKVSFGRSSSSRDLRLVFASWSRLPLGTVKVRGRRWDAFTRLGHHVGSFRTRTEAGDALAQWTWERVPSPTRRRARAAAARGRALDTAFLLAVLLGMGMAGGLDVAAQRALG